jgi:predicted ATPase
MLSSLQVSNFKAFGGEAQEIPIRPITLIFGPNSGGKSSAIHSLLLAHHIAKTGEVDVHRTELGGDAVDLGGFQRYVYRRSLENRVRLEFEFKPRDLPDELLVEWAEQERALDAISGFAPDRELFNHPLRSPVRGADPDSELRLTLEIGQRLREKSQKRKKAKEFELPTGELEPVEKPRLLGIEVEIDGTQILRLRPNADAEATRHEYSVSQFNAEHPIVQKLVESRYSGKLDRVLSSPNNPSHSVHTELQEAANDARRLQKTTLQGGFPDIRFSFNHAVFAGSNQLNHKLGWDAEDWKKRFSWTEPDDSIQTRSDLRLFLVRLIEHYIDRSASMAQHALDSAQYLGPLRSYPSRRPENNQKKDADWYAGGGYAWELLRENAEVRQTVNEWLGREDVLQTNYRIQPRRFLADELLEQELPEKVAGSMKKILAQVLGKQIDLGVAGLDELSRLIQDSADSLSEDAIHSIPELQQIVSSSVDAEELVKDWIQEMADQSDGIQDITLVDQRTLTPVSHRDVGIGISQLLPVLTYAYAYNDKLITLEQPELHLHPAVQAELGDLFIETALGEQENQFVIETHSEHLILRLLRRIRETNSGKLDHDHLKLTPSDVAVLYAEPTSKGTVIHRLRITPDGEFANRWPDGFFTEREKELF